MVHKQSERITSTKVMSTGNFDEVSTSIEGCFCEVSFCKDESDFFDAHNESLSTHSLNYYEARQVIVTPVDSCKRQHQPFYI